MFTSPIHWIVVLLIVLVLFGRGRISEIMGDFGKGIKSFKEGINEESGHHHVVTPAATPVQIAPQPIGAVDPIVPSTTPTAVPVAVPAPVVSPAPVAPVAPVTETKPGL